MIGRTRRLAPIDLAAVAERGFTTTRLLSRSQVRAVQAQIDAFGLADDHGFFASPAFRPGPASREFDLAVRRILRPTLAQLLAGYDPFMVAATTKGRRSAIPVKYHQDWTYTDERQHRPVFLWCPLVDVDERNGALRVVPGSHRWTATIRPSRRIEATEAHQDRYAELAQAVPLRAGEALVFDPATLHGSGPNGTDRARPAFTVALAPSEATLVHFHLDEAGRLHGARVDDRFFTLHPYGTSPDGYPAVEPWTRALTEDDLVAALDHDAGRPVASER